MAVNSRAKGARGELELAAYLSERGFTARRGQQFSGGGDSPDVVVEGLEDFHLECKRVERGQLYEWLEQAQRDAKRGKKKKTPVVAHRRSRKEWVAILPLDAFLALVLLTPAPLGGRDRDGG